MKVFVSRNAADTWRLRKVVVMVCSDANVMIDKSRMFAGPFFAKRLARRIERMKRRAATMLAFHEGYTLADVEYASLKK